MRLPLPVPLPRTGPEFEQQVRAAVRRSLPGRVRPYGDERPDVIDIATAIVNGPTFRASVERPTCRRDISLLAVVDGVVLDLTADLVYDTPDGVTLVTFDLGGAVADSAADDTLSARLAQAFTRATGRPVGAVEIVSGLYGSCRAWKVDASS